MKRRKRSVNGVNVYPDKVSRGGYLMPVTNGADQARKMDDIQRVIRESGCRVLPRTWLLETLFPGELAKVKATSTRARDRMTGVSLSAAVLEARGRLIEQD